MTRRGRGEGSIYRQREGLYAAYVWVTTPGGLRRRRYVYGKTREIVREKWLRAHEQARRGPVPTTTPTVAEYLAYWLAEVVEVGSRPSTYAMYEAIARLYVVPMFGPKRLDRLSVRDVRTWLNRVAATCRCCALGKDSRRDPGERRCCAIGVCCQQVPSRRTVQAARNVLRAAINTAMSEELVQRNVAALVKVPSPARRRRASWAVEDARRFLEHARQAYDPLYAAYILCLVLGLRRGEVLGLTWPNVSFDRAEVAVGWQLLRVRGELIHTETKTDASDAVLPLPEICLTALKLRQQAQAIDREQAGDAWTDTDLVFTTRWGTPIEPRNFYRSFQHCCLRAGVPPIRVHDTRRTCASLLAALDVHPRVVMEILRHAKIEMTMEIYTEVPTASTRAALKRLGESLA